MGGTHSRNKGKRGEREIVNILKAELGDDLEIGRNHAQCDNGGCDIAGRLPFSIEVKFPLVLLYAPTVKSNTISSSL